MVLAAGNTFAVVDLHEFASAEDQERYYRLIDELRCPKCQNQNLSGSDSMIAKDLRDQLFRLIGEGKSDNEIKDFMVERYGDYVLYRPRVNSATIGLWAGPFVFLLLGLAIVVTVVRRKSKTAAAIEPISAAEQAKLDAMLKQNLRD